VLLAGATGMLGDRIARHLLEQPGISVRLLIRATARQERGKAEAIDALVGRGAVVVTATWPTRPRSIGPPRGRCGRLRAAGRPRHHRRRADRPRPCRGPQRSSTVPALGFAIDLFAAPEGAPQFAMRRCADTAIDAMDLQVVHVLNGAFMDMMLDPATAGIVDLPHKTATLWAPVTSRLISPPPRTPHGSPRGSPPIRRTCPGCTTSPAPEPVGCQKSVLGR
jgi:hypothetical protein